jgi:branched-chain amino acid transport system ATP-binding protein/neutral amino acid transport system ATP-binding protein
VRFDGHDIAGARPDRIARLGLVRTFQIARGFPRLTVYENLLLYGRAQPGERMYAALLGIAAARRRESDLVAKAYAIAERLDLVRVLNAPAASLSGGQKKLLEIGRVLMADPRIILLDEPVAGVNPSLAREIAGHLRRLADGRNLAEGTFAELASNHAVQEAYMGR